MNKPDLDLFEGETAGLIRMDIDDAEKHGNLMHCVSVYNAVNDTIRPGLDTMGPKISGRIWCSATCSFQKFAKH